MNCETSEQQVINDMTSMNFLAERLQTLTRDKNELEDFSPAELHKVVSGLEILIAQMQVCKYSLHIRIAENQVMGSY